MMNHVSENFNTFSNIIESLKLEVNDIGGSYIIFLALYIS